MKKLIASCVLFVALTLPALAGDIPFDYVPPQPTPTPPGLTYSETPTQAGNATEPSIVDIVFGDMVPLLISAIF